MCTYESNDFDVGDGLDDVCLRGRDLVRGVVLEQRLQRSGGGRHRVPRPRPRRGRDLDRANQGGRRVQAELVRPRVAMPAMATVGYVKSKSKCILCGT